MFGFSYVQFHPLAYLVKLHIEMNMATLIAKVVKGTNGFGDGPSYGQNSCHNIIHKSVDQTIDRRRRASSVPAAMEAYAIMRDGENDATGKKSEGSSSLSG